MASVTHHDFTRSCTKAALILLTVTIYCVYSYFKYGYSLSNCIIVVTSIICIAAIKRLLLVGDEALANESYKISTIDSAILGQVLILALGILSIYIFAYKGAYGMYKSFANFSFTSLLYYTAVITLSYHLVSATSTIQTVLQSIKNNDITRN